MSSQPTGRSLSDQLKQLQYAEPPLDPSSFTLDDVVRGGRRRRQRRTAAQIAAAVVAVAALGTGIVLPRLHGNGDDAPPVGPTISTAPALPRVDLSDGKLKFAKKGAVVTVSKNSTVVATLTLTSATYTDTSGHAVFSVDAKQPVLLDTHLFVLYDADGGENTADSPSNMTLPTGKTTLTLDFRDTHDKPEAIGWAPQPGESGQALWER